MSIQVHFLTNVGIPIGQTYSNDYMPYVYPTFFALGLLPNYNTPGIVTSWSSCKTTSLMIQGEDNHEGSKRINEEVIRLKFAEFCMKIWRRMKAQRVAKCPVSPLVDFSVKSGQRQTSTPSFLPSQTGSTSDKSRIWSLYISILIGRRNCVLSSNGILYVIYTSLT